jgi:membrane protein DedA with SNARE-associated domain
LREKRKKMNAKNQVLMIFLPAMAASLGILGVFLLQRSSGASLIEIIVNYATELVHDVGYAGILITMALESALVPIPSEVVMPFAGFLAWNGKLDLFLVVTCGTVGNLLGSVVLYVLGSGPGLSLVKRYGKYLLIDESDMERACVFFWKYGGLIVFVGRMMPAIRTVISLPAGIAKMDIRKFVAYTFIGSVPWNMLLAYLGWLLGENWATIESYTRVLDYVTVTIMMLSITSYIMYKKIKLGRRCEFLEKI